MTPKSQILHANVTLQQTLSECKLVEGRMLCTTQELGRTMLQTTAQQNDLGGTKWRDVMLKALQPLTGDGTNHLPRGVDPTQSSVRNPAPSRFSTPTHSSPLKWASGGT